MTESTPPKEDVSIPPVAVAETPPSSPAPLPSPGPDLEQKDPSPPTSEPPKPEENGTKIGEASPQMIVDNTAMAAKRAIIDKKFEQLFGMVPDSLRNRIADEIKNAPSDAEDRTPRDTKQFKWNAFMAVQRFLAHYATYAKFIVMDSTTFDLIKIEKDYPRSGTYPPGLVRAELNQDCFRTRILTAKDVTLIGTEQETTNWKLIRKTVDPEVVAVAATTLKQICMPGLKMKELSNFDVRLLPVKSQENIILSVQDAVLGGRPRPIPKPNQFAEEFSKLGKPDDTRTAVPDGHAGIVFIIPASHACTLDMQRDADYWIDKVMLVGTWLMMGTIRYQFEATLVDEFEENPELDGEKLFEEFRERVIFEYRVDRINKPDGRWLIYLRLVPATDASLELRDRIAAMDMSLEEVGEMVKGARKKAVAEARLAKKKAQEEADKKEGEEEEVKKKPEETEIKEQKKEEPLPLSSDIQEKAA